MNNPQVILAVIEFDGADVTRQSLLVYNYPPPPFSTDPAESEHLLGSCTDSKSYDLKVTIQ
jgi:hypothetical protein